MKDFTKNQEQVMENTEYFSGLKNISILKEDRKIQEKLTFPQFLEKVKATLTNITSENLEEKIKQSEQSMKNTTKDKEYFKNIITEGRKNVTGILNRNGYVVIGYEKYEQREDLIAQTVNYLLGYNVLTSLFEDKYITDIFVNKYDNIHYKKFGRMYKSNLKFNSETEFEDWTDSLVTEGGTEINSGTKKIVQLSLYGNRFNLLDKTTSVRGRSSSIRIHPEVSINIDDLLEGKVINDDISNIYGMGVKGNSNRLVVGVTGEGKTTTMRALEEHYLNKYKKRVISVEDERELMFNIDNLLELVTTKSTEEGSKVDMTMLIEDVSLRANPDVIVTGELRGLDIKSGVVAMETGHAFASTVHGFDEIKATLRCASKLQESSGNAMSFKDSLRTVCENLNFLYTQRVVEDEEGNISRKIVGITEVSYDYEKDKPIYNKILKFDFLKNDFVLCGKISKEVSEKMLMSGVKKSLIKKYGSIEVLNDK